MADNQILFETIISGLSNQLQKLNDLTEELQGFQDVYSKDYKEVNQRIDAINVQIDKTIKEAISKIQFPKSITLEEIKELIPKEYDDTKLKFDLNKQLSVHIGNITSEILQKVDEIEIPRGEKGSDGKSATNDQVQNAVSLWIEENKDLLTGSKGDKGERGLIGQQGQIGQDGVSIEDIKRVQDDLVITLTDGTEKRIRLPKQQTKFLGGGGGLTLQEATSTLIVSTSLDLRLEAVSQNVLINAADGDIDIILPNPEGCLIRGRSYIIGITRTDTNENTVVNIISYSGELILNEESQTLLSYEVINLITDGKNWYYRS